MKEACKIGDFFVTVTANRHVIDKEHFEAMKDGAIVCNSGHFDLELNLDALREMSEPAVKRRPFVEEYISSDNKKAPRLRGLSNTIHHGLGTSFPARHVFKHVRCKLIDGNSHRPKLARSATSS